MMDFETKYQILKNKLLSLKDSKEFKQKRKIFNKWLNEQGLTKEERRIKSRDVKNISDTFFNRNKSRIAKMYNNLCGIYIVHIGYHPDNIFKIGHTDNFERRLKELDNSSVLGGIKVVDFFKTDEPINKEREIHYALREYRVQIDREFFKGDIKYFKDVIKEIIIKKNNNTLYGSTK